MKHENFNRVDHNPQNYYQSADHKPFNEDDLIRKSLFYSEN